jgi:NADPH-dependent ferric siderophore reductase
MSVLLSTLLPPLSARPTRPVGADATTAAEVTDDDAATRAGGAPPASTDRAERPGEDEQDDGEPPGPGPAAAHPAAGPRDDDQRPGDQRPGDQPQGDQPQGNQPQGDQRAARGLFSRLFLSATVAQVEQVTPHMRRIRLAGPDLADLAPRPGQQVRVNVGDQLSWQAVRGGPSRLRDGRRTYSVWSYDPTGLLDLCVLGHDGGGPGTRWAAAVRPGTQVRLSKPEGRFVLREDAPYHLFAGEETAAVALIAMARALPATATVHGVLETDTAADELPQQGAHHLFPFVHRSGRPAADSDVLVDAVRALTLPGKPGVAYLAGEARTCQRIRAHLVRERGWPRRSVLVKPFWTPGRRGMD